MSRALALLLLLGAFCSDGPSVAYVRLDGPAPALPDPPPARAHLVVFWATWCPPCVEEAPALRKLARDPPGGLRVVVLAQEDLAATRAFFAGELPAELHVRADPGGGLASAFRVSELPAAILVRDGRLVARLDGPQAWDSRGMARTLEKLAGN